MNFLVLLLPLLVASVAAQAPAKSCFQFTTTKRAEDCCAIPDAFDASLIGTCQSQLETRYDGVIVFTPFGGTGLQHKIFKCMFDCIFQEMGLLKNNTLDRVATKKFYQKSVGSDADFSPVVSKAVDNCFEQLPTTASYAPNAKSCEPAYFISNCVETYLFQNCPTPKWSGHAECAELKEKLTSGCPAYTITGDDDDDE